jgi:predicted permease
METLLQDLKYGLRMLIKSPAFTAVAILSLALGIGANTTIFTLVNAVFFQPLPVAEASRLMTVFGTDEKNSGQFLNFMPISYLNYKDYRDQNDTFSGLVAFQAVGMSLSGNGEPEQLNGLIATGNYFDVLGVKAARGRTFLPEEDVTPGTHPVVVISHGLWKRRLGGDPSIVGKTLTLNNQAYTVIGIAPEKFRGTQAIGNVDFWVPMMMYNQVFAGLFREWVNSRRALLFFVMGRLKPGVSMEQAQTALQAIGRRLEQEYPKDNEKRNVKLLPLTQTTINPNQRELFVSAGGLLTTVVGLVLLIACANVANLLLSRATARKKEIAIRTALGAKRNRIIRQLLTESVLLSLLGGAMGLILAYWGRDLLWAFRPPFFDQNDIDLSLDGRVLGFTITLSLLTGIIFGLFPALQVSRPDLVGELKDKNSQSSRASGIFNLRNLLVVFQVALSLVALIGAGLFLRSLSNAQQLNPGFETEKLLVLSFNVGAQGYTDVRGQEFYRQVQERVGSLPGVSSAVVATNPPLAGGLMRSVSIEGQEAPPGGRGILTMINAIGTKYFETLGIPIIRGRSFTETDRENMPKVAIVNEAMAKRFWSGDDPIGKRFKFFGDDNPIEVVGIAKDTSIINLGEDSRPLVYLPLLQNYSAFITLHVRSSGDPSTITATVRKEVQAMDQNMPLTGVSTIDEIINQALWAPRIGASLLAIFGLLALLLASVGIYGVLSYTVNQRSREIGIRMALGAQTRDILNLFLKQGMALVLAGVVLGLGAGFILTRLIANLLYGVTAADPITFAGTALLLSFVALCATIIPARKAAKVDPMVALRYE